MGFQASSIVFVCLASIAFGLIAWARRPRYTLEVWYLLMALGTVALIAYGEAQP